MSMYQCYLLPAVSFMPNTFARRRKHSPCGLYDNVPVVEALSRIWLGINT
ncbi:hypothetical protein [Shewanella woodyi]